MHISNANSALLRLARGPGHHGFSEIALDYRPFCRAPKGMEIRIASRAALIFIHRHKWKRIAPARIIESFEQLNGVLPTHKFHPRSNLLRGIPVSLFSCKISRSNFSFFSFPPPNASCRRDLSVKSRLLSNAPYQPVRNVHFCRDPTTTTTETTTTAMLVNVKRRLVFS